MEGNGMWFSTNKHPNSLESIKYCSTLITYVNPVPLGL